MIPDARPHSEASARNREPILAVLRAVFAAPGRVLEIGSGTGQHALYFSRQLPQLVWQASDVAENLPGIRSWLEEGWREDGGQARLPEPLLLDVRGEWPAGPYDYVFSANTSHIMGWPAVAAMFAGVGRVLVPGGCFCLYGPFNVGGRHTSDSNAAFDAMLRRRDPASGLRDCDGLKALAVSAGLEWQDEHAMPANNRLLVWRRPG